MKRIHTVITSLSPEAMDALYRHEWPGNVRELKNTIERAMVIAEGETIRPVHLQLDSGTRPVEPPTSEPPPSSNKAPDHLNDRQERLLEILKKRRSISNPDYADMMNVSDRTGLRDLRDLIDRGYVVKVGSRRSAEYRLIEGDI